MDAIDDENTHFEAAMTRDRSSQAEAMRSAFEKSMQELVQLFNGEAADPMVEALRASREEDERETRICQQEEAELAEAERQSVEEKKGWVEQPPAEACQPKRASHHFGDGVRTLGEMGFGRREAERGHRGFGGHDVAVGRGVRCYATTANVCWHWRRRQRQRWSQRRQQRWRRRCCGTSLFCLHGGSDVRLQQVNHRRRHRRGGLWAVGGEYCRHHQHRHCHWLSADGP